MRLRQPSRIAFLAACTAATLALPLPAPAAHVASVLAGGLDNPRDLAFGPDGALYVAEAGRPGGTGPSTVVRGDPNVLTNTGSVARIDGGGLTRVVTGLASIHNARTGETQGPNGIAFDASGRGYVAIGLGADPTVRGTDLAPGGADLARVVRFGGGLPTANFADPGTFEQANNPDGGPLDSNPWHLAARPGGGLLLTDAGANALLGIGPDGSVTRLAVFPDRDIGGGFPSQAVPTGVAVGPDGAVYVGQLTGFPFVPGSSRVYRVAEDGTVSVFATGFTNVTDIAVGADGTLYVLEFDADGLTNPGTNGALIRVGTDGSRATLFDDLVAPTGLALGDDGAFYVTNLGVAAGAGQVLRITEVPLPGTVALLLGGGLVGGLLRRRVHPRATED